MKILVLSDTHGETRAIDNVLREQTEIDVVVHCGDVESDCDYLVEHLPPHVPLTAVSGNNDWFAQQPRNVVTDFGGVRFYVTHGHMERVRSGHEGLLAAAAAKKCDVVLYGHTHRAVTENENGVLIVNPGALSYPDYSYALVNVENGTATAELHTCYIS